MHKEIEKLIKKLTEKLSPLKKEIYSFILHGSTVYTKEIKKHQDLDLFLTFNKYTHKNLTLLKKLLEEFTKENSNEKTTVYYSVAGSGRTAIEKMSSDKKQNFRLELFVSEKNKTLYDWKLNTNFPRYVAKNSKILMGKNILPLVKYTGDTENYRNGDRMFDKLQWIYCSILEYGIDEEIILKASEDAVFSIIREILDINGIKEARKEESLIEIRKILDKEYEDTLRATENLRKEKQAGMSAIDYLKGAMKLNEFMEKEMHGKLK